MKEARVANRGRQCNAVLNSRRQRRRTDLLSLRSRRLCYEPLEDRRLLSLDILGVSSAHDDFRFIAGSGVPAVTNTYEAQITGGTPTKVEFLLGGQTLQDAGSAGGSTSQFDMSSLNSDTEPTVKAYVGESVGDTVRVLHVDPVNGGPMVARNANVTVDFSEPMQASTLNASTVQIVGSVSGLHDGSFQYSGTTLVVDPTADFSPGETVTITVTRDALSLDGQPIAEPYTSTFSAIASAPTPITVGGTVYASTTWTSGNVYLVNSNLTISSGVTLQIEAGVVVKLAAGRSIVVRGTLDLQGTANEKVVFTSYRDDEYGGDTNGDGSGSLPAAGDWSQISYDNNNVLHDAVLRYGGSGGYGMVRGDWSTAGTLVIRDNVIERAQTGIYVSVGAGNPGEYDSANDAPDLRM